MYFTGPDCLLTENMDPLVQYYEGKYPYAHPVPPTMELPAQLQLLQLLQTLLTGVQSSISWHLFSTAQARGTYYSDYFHVQLNQVSTGRKWKVSEAKPPDFAQKHA